MGGEPFVEGGWGFEDSGYFGRGLRSVRVNVYSTEGPKSS